VDPSRAMASASSAGGHSGSATTIARVSDAGTPTPSSIEGAGGLSAAATGGMATSVATPAPTSAPTGAGDGDVQAFASCMGLAKNCGASASDDCCASLPVTGGSFFRGYDGVTDGDTSKAYPATVSDFRLDRYEVTVGRFRKFIAAWNSGWRPAVGAGKHTHVNGGQGLANSTGTTTYEQGWDMSFTPNVALADVDLSCGAGAGPVVWTPTVGGNENRPMNCIGWNEAFAFCIWDGGFLPSEAEWNYAASGGADQRVYPWSNPANSTSIDCTYANFAGPNFPTSDCVGTTNDVGSESPKGDGKYGQADLAGNLWEWILDADSPNYDVPCVDCSRSDASAVNRVLRGGDFEHTGSEVLSSFRGSQVAWYRPYMVGVRCARTP